MSSGLVSPPLVLLEDFGNNWEDYFEAIYLYFCRDFVTSKPNFENERFEEVAEPLGLDFWIGLPEEHEARVATEIPADPPNPNEPLSPMMLAILTDQTSMQAMVMFNSGGHMMPGPDGVFGFNTRAAHAAEIPAAGGIANARAG